MQLQITDGYITGFAILGGFPDGVEVDGAALDTVDHARLNCYKWDGAQAVLDEAKLAAIIASEAADQIRDRRAVECFSIINRGGPWYSRLTLEQADELDAWYAAWLDAPETGQAPEPPGWLR